MKRTTLTATAVALSTLGIAILPLFASAEGTYSSAGETYYSGNTERPKPPAINPKTSAKIKEIEAARMRLASSTVPRPEPKENALRAHASSTERMLAQAQKVSAVLTKAKDRADQEIDRRIESLQNFSNRVGTMRMSDADRANLETTMREQIDSLTALKNKIESDTSTSTLKEAVKSITESHRIYALVIPKGSIVAAADRISKVTTQLQLFSTKLATRLTEAGATHDVSSLTATLSDMNAKIADATAQSQAAVSEVSALVPDNGDATAQAAIKAALQDANKKVHAAEKDLLDARKDAGVIVKGLHAFGTSQTATSTAEHS
jgi:ABC-type transporter Mla subunit MlaD